MFAIKRQRFLRLLNRVLHHGLLTTPRCQRAMFISRFSERGALGVGLFGIGQVGQLQDVAAFVFSGHGHGASRFTKCRGFNRDFIGVFADQFAGDFCPRA